MTRAQLHALPGFHPETIVAVVAFLRANFPRKTATDATLIVNHEGWMNGYMDALENMEAATKPEAAKREARNFQPYASPQPQPENPNRPNT